MKLTQKILFFIQQFRLLSKVGWEVDKFQISCGPFRFRYYIRTLALNSETAYLGFVILKFVGLGFLGLDVIGSIGSPCGPRTTPHGSNGYESETVIFIPISKFETLGKFLSATRRTRGRRRRRRRPTEMENVLMDPETEFLASKQETGNEWELFKENVRPLKRGRNISLLNDALKCHSDFQLKKSLLDKRRFALTDSLIDLAPDFDFFS